MCVIVLVKFKYALIFVFVNRKNEMGVSIETVE